MAAAATAVIQSAPSATANAAGSAAPAAASATAAETAKTSTPMFDAEDKSSYDSDIRALIIGYADLSALCVAALGVSASAAVQRVLCVGCGTGQEVIALARAKRPDGAAPLQAVGVDPAAQMVAAAHKRLARELTEEQRARVELVQAYLHAVPRGGAYEVFDAATSVLVMHFLPDSQAAEAGSKQAYLHSITQRLRPGATLFLVDACADRSEAALPELHALMDLWQAHGQAQGLSAQKTAQKKQNFLSYHMVTPQRVTELLHAAGFVDVMQLYRGFMYTAFRARYAPPKPDAAADAGRAPAAASGAAAK